MLLTTHHPISTPDAQSKLPTGAAHFTSSPVAAPSCRIDAQIMATIPGILVVGGILGGLHRVFQAWRQPVSTEGLRDQLRWVLHDMRRLLMHAHRRRHSTQRLHAHSPGAGLQDLAGTSALFGTSSVMQSPSGPQGLRISTPGKSPSLQSPPRATSDVSGQVESPTGSIMAAVEGVSTASSAARTVYNTLSSPPSFRPLLQSLSSSGTATMVSEFSDGGGRRWHQTAPPHDTGTAVASARHPAMGGVPESAYLSALPVSAFGYGERFPPVNPRTGYTPVRNSTGQWGSSAAHPAGGGGPMTGRDLRADIEAADVTGATTHPNGPASTTGQPSAFQTPSPSRGSVGGGGELPASAATTTGRAASDASSTMLEAALTQDQEVALIDDLVYGAGGPYSRLLDEELGELISLFQRLQALMLQFRSAMLDGEWMRVQQDMRVRRQSMITACRAPGK